MEARQKAEEEIALAEKAIQEEDEKRALKVKVLHQERREAKRIAYEKEATVEEEIIRQEEE